MVRIKEKGQSLVEFGISFVFIMLLLSGAVEFGIIFFQYVQLQDAAQEGALYASVFPHDTVSIEQRVRSASQSPIDLSDPDVEIFVSYPEGSLCEGYAVKVDVVYYHKIFMPFIPQMLGSDVIMLRGDVTDTILNQECNL
jgi:hypothetical protein